MTLPDGDHVGVVLIQRSFVSRRTPEPSRFITYNCALPPPRVELKQIFVPSGDQAGSQFSPAAFVTSSSVAWKMFEMKMFPGPRRYEVYAIDRPSGDQAGVMLSVCPTVTRVCRSPS